jgi:outer membrane protein OmpA-like peptidoglycan-associated protein
MSLELKTTITGLFVAAILGGCASVAPAVLVDARNAYESSSNGLAGKMTPTELYDAEKVLDKANREFAANGDTPKVHDYSYIAMRKIELANIKARIEVDRQSIAESERKSVAARDAQLNAANEHLKQTQEQLADTRDQMKDERNANALTTAQLQDANNAKTQALEDAESKLDAEKRARMEAERRLGSAMRDLEAVAAVKQETRGVVITLNGSVLFPSGKYDLLETARARLDQVAEALKAQTDEKRMVVEGHTDNRGSDAINDPLSFNRASAVREYLISRGVDSNKITAVGMGSRRPLVDNSSAENRANNRRVEIIIQAPPLSMR